jgi:4-hydroxyphenylpyruvate dioxygenase
LQISSLQVCPVHGLCSCCDFCVLMRMCCVVWCGVVWCGVIGIDHGLAVRALGIRVADAEEAFRVSTANGAVGVMPPHTLVDRLSGKSMVIAEIKLFDDVVIRWVSGEFDGPLLPNYEPVVTPDLSFGIDRVDHCAMNVWSIFDGVDYVMNATGFHEFGEFTADDVGTVDSGLNSMVLASNNEYILLPVNEPTFGTKRKSQIQTFLEHNNGSGLQHIALKSHNIMETVSEMRKRSLCGGFEFMPNPGHGYYERIFERTGEQYSPEFLADLEKNGILVDKDDQGVLLQIFTKPLGDRTTIFIEIIER